MEEPKIVAVMPIKMNNERLPGKNTKILANKPLLQYQLNNLCAISAIKDVVVFCSNPSICEYLPKDVKFLQRSQELDLPTSNFSQIFESFIQIMDADIYVYAHATAPFVSCDTIQECLNAVVSNEYDSAFCAVKIQDFLWQDGKPLNFDATNIPRSQDIKPIYRETSGVYVFTKEVFKKYHRRIGAKPFVKEVSYKEAVDINEPADFELAQALVNINL